MTKTSTRRRPYVAIVEGIDRGVPFRVMFKRMDSARHCARMQGAVLLDLTDGRRYKFVPATQAWEVT